MANVAKSSASANVSTTLSSEINFEDLIMANSLVANTKTDDMISNSKSDKEESETIKTTTSTSSKVGLTKIAPKPSTTTIAKISAVKGANPGQVVIIQGPAGTPLPIRIAGSNANISAATNTMAVTTSATTKTIPTLAKATVSTATSKPGTAGKQTPVTIQVLKMPDGSLVQIKNNKALNLTNLSNIAQLNVGSKIPGLPVIVKTANGPKTVFGAQTKLVPGSQILKSLTLSEAQKAGFLKPKPIDASTAINKLQKILPAPANTSSSTAATTVQSSSNHVTMKEVTIKSEIDGTTKQIMVAQHTPSSNNAVKKEGAIKGESDDTTKHIIVAQHMSSSNVKEVTVKSENNGTTKQIMVAQHMSSSNMKEVTIKSENDGTTKQIIVPQHMLKLQSTAGPIQAVQIPGKTGLQYVRVLTPGASGSTSKLVSAIKKDAISPTKSHIIGTHRIVMNANGKSVSFLSATSNKDGTQSTRSNVKPSVVSTVPTLHKIQDASTLKMISTGTNDSESSPSSNSQISLKKITYTKNNNSLNTITSNTTVSSGSNTKTQFSMVPQQLLRKIQSTDHKLDVSISTVSEDVAPPKQFSILKNIPELLDESNTHLSRKRSLTPDALRRKHCNCTKSQCLKLYCDCFANGEFCQDCNCKECFNNLEYEDERQKAIKICLERNPNAFKPKITKAKDQSDLRLHNKGCNCKRSGCLKNYCECYEAKIACSSNCKCFGCRNIEDRAERDSFIDTQQTPMQGTGRILGSKRPHEESIERPSTSSASGSARIQDGQPPNKQPYNFITQDVVDATIQCMIAQADECKKSGLTSKTTERMIIEELGRCLVEIIDFSIRNMEN